MGKFDFKSGHIVCDKFYIDLDKPFIQQLYCLNEDLYLVEYGKEYLLELGWYPKHDIYGHFLIQVIYKELWDKPLFYRCCRTKSDLIYGLNEAIDYVENLM